MLMQRKVALIKHCDYANVPIQDIKRGHKSAKQFWRETWRMWCYNFSNCIMRVIATYAHVQYKEQCHGCNDNSVPGLSRLAIHGCFILILTQ